MLNRLVAFDKTLFHFVNTGLSNPVLDWFMPRITDQDLWMAPLVLLWAGLLLLGGKRGRIAALLLAIAVALADGTAYYLIKPLSARPRPSHELADSINLLVGRGGRYGFVSNHAANLFAASALLAAFYPYLRGPLYASAALVAFSRVYVGVHYPGDVLFGGILGYGLAHLILSAWGRVKLTELKRGRTWVRDERGPWGSPRANPRSSS